MCLNTRLKKISTDGACWMFRGKLFHSVGAAAAKDLLRKYSNRHLGGVSRWFSVDRRVRFGEYGISSSRIYTGASPFKALHVSKKILKSILCFTGSQCRSMRTGVMWSYLRHLVMTRLSRMILTLLKMGLSVILAWISNHTHCKVWDEITYPIPKPQRYNR